MGTVRDESQVLVCSGSCVDCWECCDSDWQSFPRFFIWCIWSMFFLGLMMESCIPVVNPVRSAHVSHRFVPLIRCSNTAPLSQILQSRSNAQFLKRTARLLTPRDASVGLHNARFRTRLPPRPKLRAMTATLFFSSTGRTSRDS